MINVPIGGFGLFYDPTIILLVPAMILSMYAQAKVSSTFKKYSGYRNSRGYTGKEIAEMILRRAGIYDVRVEHISGKLTDNYNPKTKVLNLSDAVYNNQSIAAIGVAAHECGHAIQHNTGYSFLKLRHTIYPVVNISSKLAFPIIFIGLIASVFFLKIGIILFTAVVIFQLVTLPVEFNASNRAIAILEGEGYLSHDEIVPTKKVLSAAGLTYVAAAASSISSLLRLLLILGGRDD
ncbi:MAG: zinc metallopeptidase [Vallitalea sp.]|jgi:Zn-dependent membrane protease YugP|nr:zinc metallopeptidase [Vallitalea sp.]